MTLQILTRSRGMPSATTIPAESPMRTYSLRGEYSIFRTASLYRPGGIPPSKTTPVASVEPEPTRPTPIISTYASLIG